MQSSSPAQRLLNDPTLVKMIFSLTDSKTLLDCLSCCRLLYTTLGPTVWRSVHIRDPDDIVFITRAISKCRIGKPKPKPVHTYPSLLKHTTIIFVRSHAFYDGAHTVKDLLRCAPNLEILVLDVDTCDCGFPARNGCGANDGYETCLPHMNVPHLVLHFQGSGLEKSRIPPFPPSVDRIVIPKLTLCMPPPNATSLKDLRRLAAYSKHTKHLCVIFKGLYDSDDDDDHPQRFRLPGWFQPLSASADVLVRFCVKLVQMTNADSYVFYNLNDMYVDKPRRARVSPAGGEARDIDAVEDGCAVDGEIVRQLEAATGDKASRVHFLTRAAFFTDMPKGFQAHHFKHEKRMHEQAGTEEREGKGLFGDWTLWVH